MKVYIDPLVNGKPQRGCPNDCGLCPAHLRKGCMLLELTEAAIFEMSRLLCVGGEVRDDPNIEDIERQQPTFSRAHGGPFNIQLSGGEPTLREDLPEIIWLGRQKGFTFFQLNTNGIRFAAEPDRQKPGCGAKYGV